MRGDNEHGYVCYAKIKLRNTLVNYEIDVENALISNELVLPEQFKKAKNDVPKQVIVSQQISIADELIKLKKLLDDGVLTKEEFESQKKKVLGNN
jgi:Short C-terminal domain